MPRHYNLLTILVGVALGILVSWLLGWFPFW